MNKLTVAVLFGGQSSEHEVSRVSASTILSHLDPEKYYVLPVGITKEGHWLLYNGPLEAIKTGEWEKFGSPAILSPDASQKCLLKLVGDKYRRIPIDLVFPVLHGAWGEDGTVQGLFELAGLPYVGCGVLASAVCMDKGIQKRIAKEQRVAQPDFLVFYREDLAKKAAVAKKIETKLGYPCFVKPCNAGSSVGISKATDRDSLFAALDLAAQHDRKLLIERAIVGRELECAVLGNGSAIQASCVGEVLAAADFYDYDAKYNNAASRTVIPADLPEGKQEEIQKIAKKIFQAVEGSGLARVDFFLEEGTNRVLLNELNTLPGFTAISMYPQLWAACGKPLPQLLDELIQLALTKESMRQPQEN